uniref:Uncharacterized protein n=1 Tax=Rhizophora mucronata TaxID=61149 RepID=A0A2P2N6X5_RHIMU
MRRYDGPYCIISKAGEF